MDYSKYYLRNYRPEEDEARPFDDVAPYPELPDREHTPEIVYINPDGEEFIPTPDSERIKRRNEAKKPFFTRLVINSLIAIVVILSIFVSADFITDGALVEEVTRLIYDEKPYYAVLELPADTPEDAIVNAETLRLSGSAGYPIKFDGKYYCVADLYDNRSDAEASTPPSNAVIYELTLTPPELPDEYDKYLERPHRIFDALKELEDKLQAGEIGTGEAVLQAKQLYETVLIETDELKSMSEERATKPVLEFVSDYSVALAALENICDESAAHQSYIGDLKYARCQIMFAFAL